MNDTVIDLEPGNFAAIRALFAAELAKDFPKRSRDHGAELLNNGLASVRLSGEDVRAVFNEPGQTYKVRLALPLFGSPSLSECSCLKSVQNGEPRCSHIWATYTSLAQEVERLERKDDDLFAAFDAFVAAMEAQPNDVEVGEEQRLAWRVSSTQNALDVYPVVQRRQAGHGEWSDGRRVSWADFLATPSWRQTTVDQLAVGRIKPRRLSAEFEVDTFGLLQDLEGHPMVFDDTGGPLEICAGTIGLAVKTYEGDGLVVASHIDGMLPDQQWVFSGQGYVTWSGKRLNFAPCNQATGEFLERLAQNAEPLPLDQKERLLSYLVRLEQHLAVAVADGLIADAVLPASTRVHLRLTPMQPSGLKIEMLVRPSPTGSYFPVGMGPETVLDLTETERPRNVGRDVAAERAQAGKLVDELHLDPAACYHGHIWFLQGDQEALTFVERLNEMARLNDTFTVEWPKHAQRTYDLTVPLAAQSFKLAIGEGRDWFQVNGGVDIEGQVLELSELIEAIKRKTRYIQLKNGKWTRVTGVFEKRLAKLASLMQEEHGRLGLPAASIAALSEWNPDPDELFLKEVSADWRDAERRYRQASSAQFSVPTGFKAKLRPYQMDGYQWMCRLALWGMGACLADDMGLGKTIQTLAVLLRFSGRGPSLVIAPTSVIPGWVKEARKFAPGLNPIVYRDTDRSSIVSQLKSGDLLLCSYGLAQRDIEALARVTWNVLVLDEAQAVKNSQTKTAQRIQKLDAKWRLALSGTPIENSLSELWSLFRTIAPGMLGSWQGFKKSYALPIERFDLEGARETLARRLKPFLLRRLKEDLLHDLPPKTQIDITVEMGEEEQRLYDALRLSSARSLAAKAERVDDENGKASDLHLAVLAALTRLRQMACHPRLFDPDWTGSSAKLKAFIETCRGLKENGHKALVFSQFTGHLAILAEALTALGATFFYLDGSISQQRRGELVDAFQAGEADFFLISVKAGGTGLTLTKADYVLHMDPWWNPAVEDQATDRAHRMGQTKPLTVYRFITARSVEEKIMQLHASKRALVEKLLADPSRVEATPATSDLLALLDEAPLTPAHEPLLPS